MLADARRRRRPGRPAALERAVETAPGGRAMRSTSPTAEDALQRKALTYDREGDRHYDYISAWIKATRGSDVDASLYYLAVMLEGGEDPRFIARRMVIFASEDIGNADPQALVVATAAAAGGRPGRACPSARSTSPRPPSTWRWRRSRTLRTGASSGPRRTSASTARSRRPPTCRTPTTPERASSAAAWATSTRTTSPAGSPASRWSRRGCEGERFYEPTDRGFEAELRRRLEAIRRLLAERSLD